jgi:hypothetical protein
MATIAKTSMGGQGSRAITRTTLTASDTFTYSEGNGEILVFQNDTAGALTLTIDGDGANAAFPVAGVGTINLSTGFSTGSVPAGELRAIPLDTIKEYLRGTIAVTGGSGAKAYILTP